LGLGVGGGLDEAAVTVTALARAVEAIADPAGGVMVAAADRTGGGRLAGTERLLTGETEFAHEIVGGRDAGGQSARGHDRLGSGHGRRRFGGGFGICRGLPSWERSGSHCADDRRGWQFFGDGCRQGSGRAGRETINEESAEKGKETETEQENSHDGKERDGTAGDRFDEKDERTNPNEQPAVPGEVAQPFAGGRDSGLECRFLGHVMISFPSGSRC
jgi:hypothetical protein